MVPLPDFVAVALSEHIRRFPPLAGDRTDEPGFGGLLFYGRERKPINREGVDYWRHYEPWLGTLKGALGPALDQWEN